ncbi:FYVE zinc finger-domain-containing protein [Leucosporidium creatinivorum]|uniref:FYVE zinc finger-domain-containing protein n=1 Tax=Leucosporidium creatinivorum TaxID=106004 RepID=A0A1Y2DHE9_9BASI|nr:FYVE zinc finger-domain-containing protein [Leucosporidium creatinivorum]
MSTSTGPAGYVPYTKSKRASTASVSSFTTPHPQTPPPSSSSNSARPLGLVRPASSPSAPTASTSAAGNDSPIRQPQPYRPASSAAAAWSHSGVGSSSSTPPPSSSGRPTPTQSASSALPFHSVSPGNSPFPPSTPTRNQSPAVSATQHGPQAGAGPRAVNGRSGERVRAPYHSSFQPQGVRRDRTEEFMHKRKSRGEGKKLDEGRLGRRLEKLVALHFPLPLEEEEAPTPSRQSTLASISAFGESLRGKSAKEIWSSVAGSKGELERAEQGIVKWQEDSEATRCPICMASFGIKTRRHHCRLCGRVVCFLPPTLPPIPSPFDAPPAAEAPPPIPTPSRRERCSTFFTYEYEGALVGEKKPTGLVVEVEPVEQDLSLGGVVNDIGQTKEKDERKKVRVCRDCLNTVLRQQLKTLPVRTPTWLKLYEVLVQLEKKIDEVLPEFQELVLGLQKPSAVSPTAHPSAKQAQTLRKRLLTNLASYDTISKRIRDLPLTEGSLPGGSQDRLQRAVAMKGTLYLSEKLSLLRSLGNMEEITGSSDKKKKATAKQETTVKTLASLLGEDPGSAIINEKVGPELEASGKLAVLLEQEQLVSSYVDDANSRRQFEDAASLQASLDELREEIRMVRGALA